ncbi:MAG: hypothetical protein K2I36_01100 [Ureaplasma sp.]|nr:hypothetical protein [Ureaplasma sp.]MDE7221823.1 hypothetical protein [Ureaplasma sp.]
MNKFIKNTLSIGISLIIGSGLIVLPFIMFSFSKNGLVLGNFQSYISPNVQNYLSNKYDINYQYYATNAEIPTFIKNKTLDLAIATNNTIAQLAIENQIQPVPWSKFNLEYLDENNQVKKVESFFDMKYLVTDFTWSLCEYIGKSVGINNLLEYCVPYFMQKFLFAYRGPEISELNENQNITYNNIFQYISNSSYFTNSNASVMMIEDARSIYDVASLIKDNSINDGINPKEGVLKKDNPLNKSAPKIQELNQVYDAIFDFYKNKENKNIITFNSDSSILLNKLALNQIKGAFLYTGDVIYSALNGDNSSSSPQKPNFEKSTRDFYAISPKDNFFAMDGIIFNKTLSDQKLDDACNVVKELVFSGMSINENISDLDSSENYKYLSMENFDYLLYTPCYIKLYDYAISEYFKGVSDGNVVLENFLIDVLTINSDEIHINNVEKPLNNLSESNLNVAFENFRTKI